MGEFKRARLQPVWGQSWKTSRDRQGIKGQAGETLKGGEVEEGCGNEEERIESWDATQALLVRKAGKEHRKAGQGGRGKTTGVPGHKPGPLSPTFTPSFLFRQINSVIN